jgi:hypothetical protein
MSGHSKNLPWSFDGRTIRDSEGIPVAVALNYTSVREVDPEDGSVTYNASEYAGPIRCQMIVDAVNKGAE